MWAIVCPKLSVPTFLDHIPWLSGVESLTRTQGAYSIQLGNEARQVTSVPPVKPAEALGWQGLLDQESLQQTYAPQADQFPTVFIHIPTNREVRGATQELF